ncbi:MAG: type II 3-dehydroquinate dehydratase [Flexilinea sp.]
MKLLVINGPNLNMLGIREPEVYGKTTYAQLEEYIRNEALVRNIEIEIIQSNYEGIIIDSIQSAYGNVDGIIINPAAYTHTSIAILDALKAISIPAVEVHISDVRQREKFRQNSFTALACIASVIGEGISGYSHAMDILSAYITKVRK